jgi:hypothetical protein
VGAGTTTSLQAEPSVGEGAGTETAPTGSVPSTPEKAASPLVSASSVQSWGSEPGPHSTVAVQGPRASMRPSITTSIAPHRCTPPASTNARGMTSNQSGASNAATGGMRAAAIASAAAPTFSRPWP